MNTPKPKNIPTKEWALALERAERAKQYSEKMPDFVRDSDLKFQSPMWQWQNEVSGKMGNMVGGSLSGSRPNEKFSGVSPPKNLNEIPV